MPSSFVITEGGRMVDAEVERIAAIIQDYDPNLRLAWVPPENREINEEFPFAVLYDNPNTGREELVMRLRADEVDHRVLKRLWENDNRNGNVLDAIETEEAARKAVEYQRMMDEHLERQELAAWMVNAPKGAKMGNGVILE